MRRKYKNKKTVPKIYIGHFWQKYLQKVQPVQAMGGLGAASTERTPWFVATGGRSTRRGPTQLGRSKLVLITCGKARNLNKNFHFHVFHTK